MAIAKLFALHAHAKKDLIKLFKDIIVRNSKKTTWPLGSLKSSILSLWESKRKKKNSCTILCQN